MFGDLGANPHHELTYDGKAPKVQELIACELATGWIITDSDELETQLLFIMFFQSQNHSKFQISMKAQLMC